MKFVSTFVASLALVAAGVVQAQQILSIQGTGATGNPGDRVFVELKYDYGPSFGVTSEDFKMRYDATGLSFLPEFSIVERSGLQVSLPAYVQELKTFASGTFDNPAPEKLPVGQGGYDLLFTSILAAHPRSGQVLVKAAFDIAPTAADGDYYVSFGDKNFMSDADFNEYSYPSELQNLQVTVQAAVVPEPEVALMLLPGLLLVSLHARRRRARPGCNRV